MTTSNIAGPSPHDSNEGTNESIEHFLPLILALAREKVPVSIGPSDYEDISQDVFIKLWLLSRRQTIESPKAYIRRTIPSVVVDTVRKYKAHLYQPLLADEEGEIQGASFMSREDTELGNPETILLQKESMDELMNELVDAISELYPRQQHATISTLKSRVDDLIQFVDALQSRGIDSEQHWPSDKEERQRLQASYAPAKRNLARQMDIDLSLFD